MKLIKLTRLPAGKIYVNPSAIAWVTEGEGVNLIGLISGNGDYIETVETPEEIVKLLEETK